MNSQALIVLINMNGYLGGGETLMVRFAEYLHKQGLDFLCVCAAGSYISKDLTRRGIPTGAILNLAVSPDYYYASSSARKSLAKMIGAKIHNKQARIVSFCMRDLFIAWAVSATLSRAAITHLILHIQDDLYVGQTIMQRMLYHLTGLRRFNNSQVIAFNRNLLSILNRNMGLICMADVIAQAWRKNFGIVIQQERIIPLPSFEESAENYTREGINNRIIWIGRLVDFKIPAILAMIDFLAAESKYKLTIVGEGNRGAISARMREKGVGEDRVDFVGEVLHVDLEKIIRGHSIGYAMGTSLIELARFRIPVVVALASYSHVNFKKSICGGLFFDQPLGCDGSELAIRSEDEITTSIEDAIRAIESDWEGVANACYVYARDNFSVENNFSRYKGIIESSRWLSDADKALQIPTAPSLRRLLYVLKTWRQK